MKKIKISFLLFFILSSFNNYLFADYITDERFVGNARLNERMFSQTYRVTEDGVDGVKFQTKSDKDHLDSVKDHFYEISNGSCHKKILGQLTLYVGAGALANLADSAIATGHHFYNDDREDFYYSICGSDWLTWGNKEVEQKVLEDGGCPEGDCSIYESIKRYPPELGEFNGSRKFEISKCYKNIKDCDGVIAVGKCKGEGTACEPFNGGTSFNINDRVYREKIYDGEEYANYNCKDPRPEALRYDVNINKDSPPQLYYMRGYNEGNYACERFLSRDTKNREEYEEAFNCCIEAQASICIMKDDGARGHKFCSIKSNEPNDCRIDNATEFIIKESNNSNGNEYCASTYNLCPYNFNVEYGVSGNQNEYIYGKKEKDQDLIKKCVSGSNDERCLDVDAMYDDECKENGEVISQCYNSLYNFYQVNRHCVLINNKKSLAPNLARSPYLDKSCLNGAGSSHHTYGYESYKGYENASNIYKRSFLAPAVECFVETFRNFIFNEAGYTSCLEKGEAPDSNEVCESGKYNFKIGEKLSVENGYERPLSKLLDSLDEIILATVALMITLYGYNVLISGGNIGDSKTIIFMMIKIVFVLSFTFGTFWHDFLYNFTFSVSDTFFNLVTKIGFDTSVDSNGNFVKDDGCYFGDINSIIDKDSSYAVRQALLNYDNNFEDYPIDRRYVAFFDALDCKLSKYLAFSTVTNIPALISVIIFGILIPFDLGFYFGLISLLFFFFVLNFAIKAAYIFIASNVALFSLLFLSPLIIPTMLFSKTKDIFEGWLKNLIGFAIQPIILIAFISVALNILDDTMAGPALFVGNNKPDKEIICGFSCVDKDTGDIKAYTPNLDISARNKLSDLNDTSDQTTEGLNKRDSLWIEIQHTLENEDSSFSVCKEGDIIHDIRGNSPLCSITFFSTRKIFVWYEVLEDITLTKVFLILKVVFVVFILNQAVNSIPGIGASLTGSEVLPGSDLDMDPFSNTAKAVKLAIAIKTNAKKFIKSVIKKVKRLKRK